jgi:hypothetical protein
VFDGKPFAVLGFGCTSYPRFCAAADTVHTLVSATGAQPLMPVTKVGCGPAKQDGIPGITRALTTKAWCMHADLLLTLEPLAQVTHTTKCESS